MSYGAIVDYIILYHREKIFLFIEGPLDMCWFNFFAIFLLTFEKVTWIKHKYGRIRYLKKINKSKCTGNFLEQWTSQNAKYVNW